MDESAADRSTRPAAIARGLSNEFKQETKITPVQEKPEVESKVTWGQEEAATVSKNFKESPKLQAAPPTGTLTVSEQLVNKAVADFDQELRSIAAKPTDIEKTLNSLFPSSSNSTVGSPEAPSDEAQNRRREIASHLLAAGFSLEQTREALKRTTSVEAAVEWIVEQRWAW
jgi:hypothetical protein